MDDTSADVVNSGSTEYVPVNFEIEAMERSVNVNNSPGNQIEKECPLCKSVIRYFFVNFNEKVLLCENQDCEYPYGYEDLEFVKQDEQWGSDDELESITSLMPMPAGSIISTHAWSDIEKLNKAYDLEDSQPETPISTLDNADSKETNMQEFLRAQEAELQIKKNVTQIKKLSSQLQKSYDEDNYSCIRNEKWIKNLFLLQGLSGVRLLKEQEMARLRKEEAVLGSNELTIGINDGQTSSSITVEVPNRGDASTSQAT